MAKQVVGKKDSDPIRQKIDISEELDEEEKQQVMDLPDDIIKSNAERDSKKVSVDELLNQIKSNQAASKSPAKEIVPARK